jgi:hypothetical protein
VKAKKLVKMMGRQKAPRRDQRLVDETELKKDSTRVVQREPKKVALKDARQVT